MTPQELDFQNVQSKLRKEAVYKEVQRLRDVNRNQEGKISNLRKMFFFQALFFVILIVTLMVRGLFNFSGSSSKIEIEALKLVNDDLKKVDYLMQDSLFDYKAKLDKIMDRNLVNRDEKGLKFRVQIGAFKDINLQDYTANLVAINQEVYDSINQYTLGAFKNYNEAAIFIDYVRKMGFDDSFIVSTKDGVRMPIEMHSDEELHHSAIE